MSRAGREQHDLGAFDEDVDDACQNDVDGCPGEAGLYEGDLSCWCCWNNADQEARDAYVDAVAKQADEDLVDELATEVGGSA